VPPGRGFLIAGGVVTGVGIFPLLLGAALRADYDPDSNKLLNPNGTGLLISGGALALLGITFLIVGGALRGSYNRSRRQTHVRWAPHVARTSHASLVAGLHLQF